MMLKKAFDKPIYVTRPLLPSLEEVNESLEDIWKSQWLTNNGAKHQDLESKLRDYLKIPNISLFNNGTIALQNALKALDISGNVITTPFTFAATTHSISWIGLKPVFVDIDPVTMNINPDLIEKVRV